MKISLPVLALASSIFCGTAVSLPAAEEHAALPVDWPGTEIFSGKTEFSADGDAAALGNGVVSLSVADGNAVFDLAGTKIALADVCSLEITDAAGKKTTAKFSRVTPFSAAEYAPPSRPVRRADSLGEDGAALEARFENAETGLELRWRIALRGNAPYFTQRFAISRGEAARASAGAAETRVRVTGIRLGEFRVPDADAVAAVGKVAGSPVALADDVLCGAEFPNFRFEKTDAGTVAIVVPCDFDAAAAETPTTLSSMLGFFPKEQRRRAFNFYLERERAAPSRPFLVYDGWYDLELSPSAEKIGETIDAYGDALVKRREIAIGAFVLDDGWDDPERELWAPAADKFPEGLSGLAKKAAEFGAGFGIWISPTGGCFGVPERLKSCKKLGGIAEDAYAFDLADPLYEKWFFEKCRSLVLDDGVTYFKWDRIGEDAPQHFLRLIDVADRLREIRPELFINATVGSWPSPFWLNHVDSTWRGGADIAFQNSGIGDARDRWISFRDFELIENVCSRAPLYPIGSVMHHGIVLGTHYQGATCAEAGNDLRREIFSYFALGPNLRELYLDFRMLDDDPAKSREWALEHVQSPRNDAKKNARAREAVAQATWIPGGAVWNAIARASVWARENAAVLADMHWVAGKPCYPPAPYAFAGWHRGNGVVYLRNASDKPAQISFSLEDAFELPPTEPADARYSIADVYVYGAAGSTAPAYSVPASAKMTFRMNPLEIRILQAARR